MKKPGHAAAQPIGDDRLQDRVDRRRGEDDAAADHEHQRERERKQREVGERREREAAGQRAATR